MEISQAIQLLGWSEKMLRLIGVRPSNPNDTLFVVVLGYLMIHVSLEYADLIQFLNSLENVVANLKQTIMFTLTVIKVIVMRWKNQEFGIVIGAVKEDLNATNYKTPTEKSVFLASYAKARRIVVTLSMLAFFTAICMYLAPLIDLLETLYKHGTVELHLPYHARMFYDVSEVRAYTLTYLLQLPCLFLSALGHLGPECLIITLTFHICGQLSLLVERIDNLSTAHREIGTEIAKVVKMHVRLITLVMNLAEASSTIFLSQALATVLLICILSYNILVNAEEGKGIFTADFFNSLSFIFAVVLTIFAHCYVGERLIEESTRVHRAFGECGWEKMPIRHAKSIIICLARSQQPLELTAGKFYTLSLSSFTDIMRTSMAYFSVLRSLV